MRRLECAWEVVLRFSLIAAAWCLLLQIGFAAVSYSNAVLQDSPVAYYRLEEPLYAAADTRSTNLGVGNHLHGIYRNFVAGELAQSGPQTAGFGSNLAPVFDATDNYVERAETGSPWALDLTDGLTLEAWVNVEAGADLSGAPGIVSKYFGTGGQRSYTMRLGTSGNVNFAISDNGQWQSALDFSAGTALTPGQWYHVAGHVRRVRRHEDLHQRQYGGRIDQRDSGVALR